MGKGTEEERARGQVVWVDGGSKRTAEGAQQRGLQQILEVKPEDKVETLHCSQRESGERILEEAREWDG